MSPPVSAFLSDQAGYNKSMLAWLLLLGAVAAPLGARVFVTSVIPGFHEYEAIFVYCSDLFVLLLIVAAWRLQRARLVALIQQYGAAFIFVLIIASLAASVHAVSFGLSLYVLLRLVLLIGFAYSIGALAHERRFFHIVLLALAAAAVVEAVIGLAQFRLQGSVGLSWLGEPTLIASGGATSTIALMGGRILRVYGTFPHPNIYGAFLLIGILSLAYWYYWCGERLKDDLFKHPRSWWTLPRTLQTLNQYLTHRYFFWRLAIAAALFITGAGLALSFSRSAWIAGLCGLVVFAALLVVRKKDLGGALRLILMLVTCTVAIYLLFAPLIAPRSTLRLTDKAVSERLSYDRLGFELMQEELGGVGLGNQVLYGVDTHRYQRYGFMHVWSWEPIHNLYLLVIAETGWLGLLSFLAFLGMVTWHLLRANADTEQLFMAAAVATILILGLFDHFLWTLQPGRLMLWLVIGLAFAVLPVGRRSQ